MIGQMNDRVKALTNWVWTKQGQILVISVANGEKNRLTIFIGQRINDAVKIQLFKSVVF